MKRETGRKEGLFALIFSHISHSTVHSVPTNSETGTVGRHTREEDTYKGKKGGIYTGIPQGVPLSGVYNSGLYPGGTSLRCVNVVYTQGVPLRVASLGVYNGYMTLRVASLGVYWGI